MTLRDNAETSLRQWQLSGLFKQVNPFKYKLKAQKLRDMPTETNFECHQGEMTETFIKCRDI